MTIFSFIAILVLFMLECTCAFHWPEKDNSNFSSAEVAHLGITFYQQYCPDGRRVDYAAAAKLSHDFIISTMTSSRSKTLRCRSMNHFICGKAQQLVVMAIAMPSKLEILHKLSVFKTDSQFYTDYCGN